MLDVKGAWSTPSKKLFIIAIARNKAPRISSILKSLNSFFCVSYHTAARNKNPKSLITNIFTLTPDKILVSLDKYRFI